jgi:hypothetical protein
VLYRLYVDKQPEGKRRSRRLACMRRILFWVVPLMTHITNGTACRSSGAYLPSTNGGPPPDRSEPGAELSFWTSSHVVSNSFHVAEFSRQVRRTQATNASCIDDASVSFPPHAIYCGVLRSASDSDCVLVHTCLIIRSPSDTGCRQIRVPW